MSRRSRKSKNKQSSNAIPILIGIGIAVVAAVAIFLIMKVASSGGATATPLDHSSYNKASKNHQGNREEVTGTITARLPQSNNKTLLTVEPDELSPHDKPLGILVTQEVRDEFKEFNLDISNTYIFVCKIESDGFLYAEAIRSK